MNNIDAAQAMRLLSFLLRDGCKVSVHDGEAFALKLSTDVAALYAAMGSTDEDTLVWRDANDARLGSFFLVYGNEPGVLIADYSDNTACNALMARYEEKTA